MKKLHTLRVCTYNNAIISANLVHTSSKSYSPVILGLKQSTLSAYTVVPLQEGDQYKKNGGNHFLSFLFPKYSGFRADKGVTAVVLLCRNRAIFCLERHFIVFFGKSRYGHSVRTVRKPSVYIHNMISQTSLTT